MTRFGNMVVCTLILIYSSKHHSVVATNKAHKFNVLLNLYKMNPLKESNIYKQFVQQTMSKTETSKIDPSVFESNESIKRRTNSNLKRIENIIHSKRQKTEKHNETYYDINNVEPEKFSFVFVTKSPELPNPITSFGDLATEHFNIILGHIESEETGKYTTSKTDEGLATEFKITKTSPTTVAYEEPTTKTYTASTTKPLDSIEFDKFTENKHYNKLFQQITNEDIQKENELIIPINDEKGLSLPIIDKYDKVISNLNIPDDNNKSPYEEQIKHDNKFYLPNFNNKRNKNDFYVPNFNLEEDKRLNLPNNARGRSKNNDISFGSSNRLEEKDNNIYKPISDYADLRKNELYLSKNNLKGFEVNLQNQMYYPSYKSSDQELYLPVNNHVNEGKTDNMYLPVDQITRKSKKEIYLPIVSKVDFENHDIHDEVHSPHYFLLPGEKNKEVFSAVNNKRKNEINLAHGNMFHKGGANSVLDVVILR